MNKESYPRNESIHLYNPEKDGWTSYDINYANALRKSRKILEKNTRYTETFESYAA